MNLTGSLGSFGLADLLALVAMGRKSGVVRLRQAGRSGAVWLIDGMVSGASSDESRDGLLRRVVAAGRVPAPELAAALTTGAPLTALLRGRVIDPGVLQTEAIEHIVDSTCELLAWTVGDFEVSVEEFDPADLGLRLPVADLVSAAATRTLEWDSAWQSLPDPTSVPVLRGDPPDGEAAPSLVLDPLQWRLIAAIDGRRTLREVAESAGGSPLAGGNALAELLARGLIELVAPSATGGLPSVAELLAWYERGMADRGPASALAQPEDEAIARGPGAAIGAPRRRAPTSPPRPTGDPTPATSPLASLDGALPSRRAPARIGDPRDAAAAAAAQTQQATREMPDVETPGWPDGGRGAAVGPGFGSAPAAGAGPRAGSGPGARADPGLSDDPESRNFPDGSGMPGIASRVAAAPSQTTIAASSGSPTESPTEPPAEVRVELAAPVPMAPSFALDWSEPSPARASHAAPDAAGSSGLPTATARIAGAVVVDPGYSAGPRAPSAPGRPGGAEAARAQNPPATAIPVVSGSAAVQPQIDEDEDLQTADGLSRGLLMQLIAGVRGL